MPNRIVIASAGSGKTTSVVAAASEEPDTRTGIVTYTRNGRREIIAKAYELVGHIPPHVTVDTWFSFVLRHFVRPYQRCLHGPRIQGVCFVSGRSAPRVPERQTRAHYFAKPNTIYSDKISKFACRVIDATGGLPVARFEKIFDRLIIDESQDLAGYDLELVERLLQSTVDIELIGDHRQAVFSTHSPNKNRQYGGSKVINKFQEWATRSLCSIEYQDYSHRSVQLICDFADQFHPDASPTESRNGRRTGHDGVFAVRRSDVARYFAEFRPQPLRYDRRTKCSLGNPINYGASKGMTFERTLIFPHGPLKRFLSTGRLSDAGKEREKLYVAVTRARQSVAFVVEDTATVVGIPVYEPERS